MLPPVRLRVLGPVRAEREGEDLDLMPVRRSLLAALVLDAPRAVPVETLQSRLWDDEGRTGSVTTLHSHISRLRQQLGADVLRTQAPGYRLDLGADALDVLRFRELVRAAREEPDAAVARAVVGESLALWRDDAYADVPQLFARTEAARLQEQRLEAHELAAELDLHLGRHRQVADELPALLAAEPLREGLRAALMVALYRCGRQAAALEVYEEGRHLLVDSLGVDPGPALRRLHEQVLRQDPALDPAPAATATSAPIGGAATSPAPATRSGPAPSSQGHATLVEPPTPLIGRDADVDDAVRLLDEGARLVTLTGAGGVGKTRLALAMVRRLRPRFGDAVVLVPLATVADAALVLPTVAHAVATTLGVPVTGADDVGAALVEQLGDREALVVLDNVEHLLGAAADVGRLVAGCPGLVVLVTSRAPLRVAGEHERLVDPLALPAPSVPAAETTRSSAVSLFVARARAVAPGFAVDDDNAHAVAAVCRRLGGIPLAIELAAARLRYLGPQALLEHLDDALDSGPRDLPERQRTMQATLDWSYRLLDEDAQRLFRTLAVFAGGFTLDLLDAVAGPTAVRQLEELVEHSLVSVTWSRRGTARYRMLEPTLQHARRLVPPDEEDAAARAHARACVALAEEAAAGYLVADQVRWLEVVDDEHANLLAAVDRATVSGDHDVAARIVWALWLYWWFRGHAAVGRRTAAAAAALPGASEQARTRATIALAAMAFAQADHAAAGEAWSTALAAATRIGDVQSQAHSEAGLGIVAITGGDLPGARHHQRRAIALAGTLGPDTDGPWILAINHVWLGTALLEDGRRDEALEHFHRGLGLARDRGDRLGAFVALWNLARAEAGHDDAAAHRHLREGIAVSRDVGDLANLSYFLDALVVLEVRRDGLGADTAPAVRWARLLGAAESLRELGHAGYGYYFPDDDARDQASRLLAAGLGGPVLDEQVRAGRLLALDDAVALALT